jgi:hypothetical protein
MSKERSIILAVVSARNDFALQEVTELARQFDPLGSRTLGLITKPDALDLGSEGEASYVKLAQNKDVTFRLGWHVLKNRHYEIKDSPAEIRDAAEAEFFAKGIWTTLDPAQLGIAALKVRLSEVLTKQILAQLPEVRKEVNQKKRQCLIDLERLGTSRPTMEEKRRYLMVTSREFATYMKAAVDGMYSSSYFESVDSIDGCQKRLRAVVTNILTEFGEEMRIIGHARNILESFSDDDSVINDLLPENIPRETFMIHVKDLMTKSRGCELPGTFNPALIGDLFTEHCQPWRNIAQKTKKRIMSAVCQATVSIVRHVTDEDTFDEILVEIGIDIENYSKALDAKVEELLLPHYKGHPITYNRSLMENVHHAQSARQRIVLEKALRTYLRVTASSNVMEEREFYFAPGSLLSYLEQSTKKDMESYASEMAVDYMQAYYQVLSA